jgi:hypothetical protein
MPERDALDMTNLRSSAKLGKRALASLGAGDPEFINALLAEASGNAIAESLADLLDGSAQPGRVIGRFIEGCGNVATSARQKRRAEGRKTPTSQSDIPSDPNARRRYLNLAIDALSQRDIEETFGLAFVFANDHARTRAAHRLRKSGYQNSDADMPTEERRVANRAIECLGAQTAQQRLRMAWLLTGALEDEMRRSAAVMRTSGSTWRTIGEAVGISAGTARKRYG